MGLTVTAGTAGLVTGKTTKVAQRAKQGASVKDIAGEQKDKFVSNAKTAGKVTLAAGVSGAAATAWATEVLNGAVSKRMPAFVKNIASKIGNSKIIKNATEFLPEAFEMAGQMIKAHPVAYAGAMIVSAVAGLCATKALLTNAKNQGKIEQKYDDKIQLKNEASKALE